MSGMWCQNCGVERKHHHRMGATNSEYCQRCRTRGRDTHTYCRYCGEERYTQNSSCDVHYGNSSGNNASDDESPPNYSPLSSDDDKNYATDVSDSPSISPSPSPSPDSTSSERQCGFCNLEFDSEKDKDDHRRRNDSGCSEHNVCFPSRENYTHAKTKMHTQCFVLGCETKYADDLDWSDKDIERHVRSAHM